MNRAAIDIQTHGGARPSEVLADLNLAAEALYFPMKMVGFWDERNGAHLCPQEERRQPCPHGLPKNDPAHVDYELAVQRDRRANLRATFPHAGITIYLG